MLQLPATGSGEAVEPGATSQLGNAPLGLDPAMVFQPVEGRIKRALVHLEHILRYLLNTFGDSPAMQSAAGPKGAKDEKVKSTLQEIES